MVAIRSSSPPPRPIGWPAAIEEAPAERHREADRPVDRRAAAEREPDAVGAALDRGAHQLSGAVGGRAQRIETLA